MGRRRAVNMTAHGAGGPGEARFAFGENWTRFLQGVNDEIVAAAKKSLAVSLGTGTMEDRTFLDIGSGSGLSSLAARLMGARVLSFDFDPLSVACTRELRRRYRPDDRDWEIREGSVLDGEFLAGLGLFDVVYSWGVLHHTGRMWEALEGAAARVRPGGLLLVALYNDQGWKSGLWRRVKQVYCGLPRALRWVVLYPAAARLWGPALLRDLLLLHPGRSWNNYRSDRGMSPWHDIVDWVGGYPFEAAKPAEVSARLLPRGFSLVNLRATRGHGCNEFLFLRKGP